MRSRTLADQSQVGVDKQWPLNFAQIELDSCKVIDMKNI